MGENNETLQTLLTSLLEVLNGIPQARQREKYLKGRSGKRYLYHIAAQKKEYLVSAGLSSWLGESEPEM